MEAKELLDLFQDHPVVQKIANRLRKQTGTKIKLENGIGSLVAFIAAAVGREMKGLQLFVLNDKEEAAYFYNDLLTFYDEENVRFLPSSFRRSGNFEDKDNDSILVRTEVLNALTGKGGGDGGHLHGGDGREGGEQEDVGRYVDARDQGEQAVDNVFGVVVGRVRFRTE